MDADPGLDLLHADAESHIDPLRAERVGEHGAGVGVDPPEQSLPALDDRHLRPHPCVELRELAADRPAAASSVARSIVFVGMHAKYEHSPPTRRLSTSVTSASESSRRSAPTKCSPVDPPPRTKTFMRGAGSGTSRNHMLGSDGSDGDR